MYLNTGLNTLTVYPILNIIDQYIYPKESEEDNDYVKIGNQIIKIRYIDLKRASEKDYLSNFVSITLKEYEDYK